jgi:hypothetical protein
MPRRGARRHQWAGLRPTGAQLLAAELEDWAITAHRIAAMAVRRDRPVWLVIVVTKTDLFPDAHRRGVAVLLAGQWLGLRSKLDELRALAGGARFSIDVLPMCAPDAKLKKGTPCERHLAALETRMAQLSGHV